MLKLIKTNIKKLNTWIKIKMISTKKKHLAVEHKRTWEYLNCYTVRVIKKDILTKILELVTKIPKHFKCSYCDKENTNRSKL